MRLTFIAITAVIAVIFLLILANPADKKNQTDVEFCSNDIDCVPKQCCHPDACVNINYKPDCYDVLCTAVCQGPIDCGAGMCGCINSKCEVIPLR